MKLMLVEPCADNAPAKLAVVLNVIEVEPEADTTSCRSTGGTVKVMLVEPVAGRPSVPDAAALNVICVDRDEMRPACSAINQEAGCVVPSGCPASSPNAAVWLRRALHSGCIDVCSVTPDTVPTVRPGTAE